MAERGVKRLADHPLEDGGDVKKRHLDGQEQGSGETIPHDIQVVQFAESRAAEIKALEKEVTTFKGTKSISQRLPKHMRRRAMSHNIKRLPKVQRAMAEKAYENQLGAKKKRPSRYHRRRPKNLLKEYTRRQRKHIWLETHIWHAKRFHMVEKWGHKLPWKPTMKGERAAYRAASKHCLLQDMSYMCCIELQGTEQKILDGLGHLTNAQTGPTFASKACIQGTREGSTVLYQCDDYPDHCIGPVTFLWKPQLPVETGSSDLINQGRQLVEDPDSNGRQLWLWCHPASFDLVWREILKSFDVNETYSSKNVADENKSSVNAEQIAKEIELRNEIIVENNGAIENTDSNKNVSAEEIPNMVVDNDCIKMSVEKNVNKETIIVSSDPIIESAKVLENEAREINCVQDLVSQNDSEIDWQQFSVVGTIKESFLEKKGKKKFQKNSKVTLPEPKLAICDKFKSEEEVTNGEVTVKSLAGSLLRYRLSGPLSNAVLVDALQQANVVPAKNSGDSVKWWHKYYADSGLSLGHSQQKDFWDSVGQCLSPAELSPHCVIGLTVQDPRLGRPVKRTKIYPNETDPDSAVSISREKTTESISLSPLWDSSIREEVSMTKMADFEIHKLKEENLVPGFPLHLGNDESKIPVLLVQNPGVTSPTIARGHDPTPGRGSGWDLILPKGWGRPFWLSLVYREARCGGIHELECNAFEQGSLQFPHDYPDSVAGKKHQLEVEFSMVEKYNRRPPAKRPNYVKLGVPSPFYCPWFPLVKYWSEQDKTEEKQGLDKYASFVTEGADYFILRERKLLRKLGNILEVESLKFADGKSRRPFQSKEKLMKLERELFEEVQIKYRNTLVPVRVDMLHKGTPAFCAQICIPSKTDIDTLKADQTYGGPVESLHRDQKKLDHKKAKKELKEKTGKKKVKLKLDQTMKLFSDNEKEADIQVCDRKVIGYLNSGGFSLGVGSGHGIGFCATLGLYFLLKNVDRDIGLLVLLRNPTSRQYRFAKLSLIG